MLMLATDEMAEANLVFHPDSIGFVLEAPCRKHLERQISSSFIVGYPMPNLLNHLAAPGCNRLGSHWDCCGALYVEPIEGS